MIIVPMNPPPPHLCHQQPDPSTDSSPVCDQISDPATTQTSNSSSSSSSSNMLSVVSPSMPGPNLSTPRKPKLSLQTNSLPITYGKSTTALSLSLNIPTSSPTVLNTFNNAYDRPRRSSPVSQSPTVTIPSGRPRPSSRLNSPYTSLPHDQPYQLPLGIRGILRNSPIPAPPRRASLSAGGNTRRFFPPPKRVAYRFPLEEEIKTVKYVIPHSEVSSEEESHSDSDASNTSSYTSSSGSSSEDEQGTTVSPKKRKSRSGKHVRITDLKDEESEDGPKTPAQGRRKRRRQWEWTLGPLDEGKLDEEGHAITDEVAEDEKVKGIVVDELARVARPTTPEIPLPDVTATEIVELEESYRDAIEEYCEEPITMPMEPFEDQGVSLAKSELDSVNSSLPEASTLEIPSTLDAAPASVHISDMPPAA